MSSSRSSSKISKSRKKRTKVVGALFGTVVEYYDYSLYGFSASLLAAKFFPSYDELTALMYVFMVYAASYVMKPFGALFFSRIGDFMGRKASLRITIIGIAFPTMSIGLLPDYNSVGVISTVILVVCRLMQGFFTAGEYDGAAIYVIEHLGEKQHYTASAITRSIGVAGLLLGIISTNFFNSSLVTSFLPDFAWRIPFLLSMPLALITMYFRKYMEETPDFHESINSIPVIDKGSFDFLIKEWKKLSIIAILAGGFGVTYQITVMFMKQYLPLVAASSTPIITSISVVIVFIFGISMPFIGLLADKFGYMIVIRISFISSVLLSIAFYFSLKAQNLNLILICVMALPVSVASFNCLAHGAMIKAFPTNNRYRGISIGHTVGSMILSGTANSVCLYFMDEQGLTYFPIAYLIFFSVISYFSFRAINSKTEAIDLLHNL